MSLKNEKRATTRAKVAILHGHGGLQAPAGMPAAQVAVWQSVVRALPPDHFSPDQAHLLANYCQLVVRTNQIEQALDELNPVDQEFDRLTKLACNTAGKALALARALRMTNISRQHHATSGLRAAAHQQATQMGVNVDDDDPHGLLAR